MIVVKLMGGHSNQLFQYAIGRQLAIKHDASLKLDCTWFKGPFPPGTTLRHYELDAYPIKAAIASKADLALIDNASQPKNFLSRLKFGRATQLHQIDEDGPSLNRKALTAPDNSYLVGYWQNEAYFKNIRPTLIKELEPTKPMTTKNKIYLKQIQNSEAISLHVRREDYISNQAANDFHGVMPLDYYHKALELIAKKRTGNDLKIFVFSKEIDWCKKNLKFDLPTVFIEGNKDGADDMRLMKHCKHNIMANSSFSWWGAWLNQNPNKIIVAPRLWFQDEQANKQADIVPKDWIRL